MRIPRIYISNKLTAWQRIALPEPAAHHVVHVLRRRNGDSLILFDGWGGEYPATIDKLEHAGVHVCLGARIDVDRESPLQVTLAQGIARGTRMDYAIQKAVELGVSTIAPLLTHRTTIKLSGERRRKKEQHWQGIIISACEQSGRNRVPTLEPVMSISDWLELPQSGAACVLCADAPENFTDIAAAGRDITLLVGPEGGLDDAEIQTAERAGYRPARIGPRTLRAETVAIAALAVIQATAGDFRLGEFAVD